jgi:hypothetical protein
MRDWQNSALASLWSSGLINLKDFGISGPTSILSCQDWECGALVQVPGTALAPLAREPR